ncbi:SDR family oxidoreductase [Acidisoma sp. S159]|uniref:SDR family oxidoreductase n=1 Tax=Acidisoma sp. S159 TaxID=1747225 RepID=UPI00131BB6F1|nr:SDR family oxidoreductase [Acidisoma sp. S159]
MSNVSKRTVLVTGTSSGIGRATALHLAQSGVSVFAACRRLEDGASLARETHGLIIPLIMDVADIESIARGRQLIENATNGAGLDGLVNNAGIGMSAPVEAVDLERVRRIFDVNVFGQLAMIQVFLPLLRRRSGRIVNVGSVGAKITIPFGGALCASKAAFESFSDALRMELHPFGIQVCVVQPGSIRTPAVEKTLGGVDTEIESWPPEARSRYGAMFRIFSQRATARENRGSVPDVVALAIYHALTSDRPKIRYRAGKDATLLTTLPRILPDRILDKIRLRMLGLPLLFGQNREAG